MRPVIGLQDLATAVISLNASPETAARIARMLDLAPTPERQRQTATTATEGAAVPPEQPDAPEAPREPGPDHRPGQADLISNQPQARLITTPLERAAVEPPAWLKAPLGRPPRRAPATALPLAPLLEPRLTPAILMGVIRTWHREGAVDADALTDFIARQRPAIRVPRLFAPTLRMGVELLVDRGHGMVPFEPDIEYLIGAIIRVVGAAVTVRSFDDTPLFSGTGPRRLWSSYRPPPTGTPIVALSDFGIARPAVKLLDDWLELSRQLRRTGNPLVGFVPWPKRRHPPELKRDIPMLVWDRSTTLTSLREAMRRRVGS